MDWTLELEYNQAHSGNTTLYTKMYVTNYVSQACFLGLCIRFCHQKVGMEQRSESRQACTQTPDQSQNRWGAQVQVLLPLEAQRCVCACTYVGTQNDTAEEQHVGHPMHKSVLGEFRISQPQCLASLCTLSIP